MAADEVDRIVAAWQRELPDLDVSPLHVLSRISRLARHLDRDRAAAFTGHGLEGWEFDVLAALRRAGEPYQLSPGQLGAQTMVTSGTITNRVGRLLSRDLVRRRASESDRRGVLVRLTATGRDRVDAAMADLVAREAVILEHLTDPERDQLTGLLRILGRSLDRPADHP